MADQLLAAVRRIGFNESVERDGRSFHVQTEVHARNGIVIRTTVHEGGTVVHTDTQPVAISEGETLAEAQHDGCVDRLRRAVVG
jgi:hypothetical protein